MDVDTEVLVTPTPAQTQFNHEFLWRPASISASFLITLGPSLASPGLVMPEDSLSRAETLFLTITWLNN
jgi:hypothetical protein